LIINTGSEGQGVAKTGHLELENQQGCEPFEGSNPSLSAIIKGFRGAVFLQKIV